MESMCRQRASFYPGEAWKFLAEAEMWHHRSMDLLGPGLRDDRDIDHEMGSGLKGSPVAARVSATN